MARGNAVVPTIYHHSSSGQAAVRVPGPDGRTRTLLLGAFGSTEAEESYKEVLVRHLAGKVAKPVPKTRGHSEWPTVAALVAEFVMHARSYYRNAAGEISREVVNFLGASRELLLLAGDMHVDQFSVRDLASVRQAMAESGKLCRTSINDRIRRCRAVFRWGVERELVPGSTWHQLASLRGLSIGRCGVRESDPVQAVPWGMVEPVLPHLTGPLRAAVLLQWHTGMRPSEMLAITRGQLDISDDAWVYRPRKHKGNWRGLERAVHLGPKAREVLAPLLKVDPDAALISPIDAIAEVRSRKRRDRKTPVTRQTRDRDRRSARKAPHVGAFYKIDAYRKAIHRACDVAGVPRWSPHRLRHAAATRIVLSEGIEACKAVLGHADIRMATRYSVAADAVLARRVAERNG